MMKPHWYFILISKTIAMSYALYLCINWFYSINQVFLNSILTLNTSKIHIYYSSNSNIESINISLSTDVFLLDHIYINYTYKITLKCVFLLILSFFLEFFQAFLWILNNFYSTDICEKISVHISHIFPIYL